MGFRRYPKYKDSGVEWLGAVPSHWTVNRLKCNLRLLRAKSETRRNPIALENVESWTGRLVSTGTDFEGEGIAFDEGDILFGKLRPYLAKVHRAESPGDAVGDFLVMRSAPGMDSRFTQFQILNRDFIDIVDGSTFGSKMPRASWEFVGGITVATPPFEEQGLISAFLNRETAKIDELIVHQQRLIELLKEKRQAVISGAVTKGLNADAPTKPSSIEWLGEIPVHWEIASLKRVADVNTGVAKGKDNGSKKTINVPYLRVANVQDGYLDLETVATIDIPATELERYALKRGDVLMNEGGDFDKLGRGCVWDGQIDPCITQNHVFAVRPRQVSPTWLNAITGSGYAQFYFMTRSKQSTNLASISSTNLMDLPVVLPPATEQRAIVSYIAAQTSQFDALTGQSAHAVDLLHERRTALISAAVTGRIDVRHLAGAHPA